MPKTLLPYTMQDESNLALEECINKAFSIDMTKFLLSVEDNLEDAILFEKAKMFHVLGVEGWKNCKNREDKITLLKNAIRNHRFKGTVNSIKTALSKFKIIFKHWKDYNGCPNHFKLRVLSENTISQNDVAKIFQTVNEYKRHSAKLDAIEFNINQQTDLCLNSTLILSKRIRIGE